VIRCVVCWKVIWNLGLGFPLHGGKTLLLWRSQWELIGLTERSRKGLAMGWILNFGTILGPELILFELIFWGCSLFLTKRRRRWEICGSWSMVFKFGPLSGVEIFVWENVILEDLLGVLEERGPTEGDDVWWWNAEDRGGFLVKSAYNLVYDLMATTTHLMNYEEVSSGPFGKVRLHRRL